MAVVDQGALDRFAAQVGDVFHTVILTDEVVDNLGRGAVRALLSDEWFGPAAREAIAKAVGDHQMTSQIDKKQYASDDFVTYTDRTTQHNETSLAALTAKLDNLTATVEALVARLGPANVKP